MWVAILGLCLLLGGWAWSSSWKSFTPNQLRGLQQFDKEQYDSSFVNLIEFRDDTSHHFATQYNLAYMYDNGKGAIVNDRLAFELYSECLKSSTPEVVSKSLYALGWCYLLGEGCTRDTALAINNFGFAASQFNNIQARVQYERLRKESPTAVSESNTQKTEPPMLPASLSPSAIIESVAADPMITRVTVDAEESVINRVVQLSNCTRVDFTCKKRQDSYIYLPGSWPA
ncbi:tetratricopeptide repeat protein [Hymenobacter humi]|uniref:Tetratricopeptide repeat protein n=1 Tax=Hymenobacter humi TaxID=1411620 RepID=A0ABW2U6D8_9BACT